MEDRQVTINDKLPLKTILAREGIDGVMGLLHRYCNDLMDLNRHDPEIHAYWEDQKAVLTKARNNLLSNTRSLP